MEPIENATQLSLRIMHLKARRFEQEEEMRRSFRELLYFSNPINMVKESVGSFFGSEGKTDNGALFTGILSIVDMFVLRRPGSFKKALLSLGLNAVLGNLSKDKLVAIKDRVMDLFGGLRRKDETSEEETDDAEDFGMDEEIPGEPMNSEFRETVS